MTADNRSGACSRPSREAPTLWAVGGGKGGVGKTLVCSSLAIAFARRGHRCAAIDLDLGAANLHSLLNVASPRFTISDFLNRRVETLGDVLCSTPYPNLALASGARASLEMANPKFSQKEKLLRHIRRLDVDHVFLDLSAGCAFNALDFFLAAKHGIAVVVPERTSIENTQHFLKTAFFRSLRTVARQEPLRGVIKSAMASGRVRSARDLIHCVAEHDGEQGRLLARRAGAFSPTLVVNQIESSAEQRECARIALACRHHLAAGVQQRGALPRDPRVRDAVAEEQHVLARYPGARFSVAVEALASDLSSGISASPLLTAPAPPERPALNTRELPSIERSAPGAYLRSCRERLGLSLAEVGRRTRIRSLASIEDENFEALPPERYVAAFVSQYARALGIGEFEHLTRRYVERYRAAGVAG